MGNRQRRRKRKTIRTAPSARYPRYGVPLRGPNASTLTPAAREQLIGAWRQIVGMPSLPDSRVQIQATRFTEARLAARRYGAPGYDLLAAAPELACALDAADITLEAPMMDVLAIASVDVATDRTTKRWAWIGLCGRGPESVVLVTASQRVPAVSFEGVSPLARVRDSFAVGKGLGRTTLPFASVGPIAPRPGVALQFHVRITARPLVRAFRPVRLMISQADQWLVHDILIGNRSQFMQAGAIPGGMFDATAGTAIDSFVSLEMAQTAMDIVLVVEYVGLDPDGAPFYATMIGDTEPYADGAVRYHGQPLDAVMAAPVELRKLLAAQLQLTLA
jgi:hypothetical protein